VPYNDYVAYRKGDRQGSLVSAGGQEAGIVLLLSQLGLLYENKDCGDITLIATAPVDPNEISDEWEEEANESRFIAHKCILSARSSYFRARFSGGEEFCASPNLTSSKEGDTLRLEDCDPDALGRLLRYLYVGSIQLPEAVQCLVEVITLTCTLK